MVTNTSGTTNDIASNVKENGDNNTTQDSKSNNEEYKNLKQSSDENNTATTEVEKVSAAPLQNDVKSKMSNASDQQSFNPAPNSNGIPANAGFENRTYGNGVAPSVPPPVTGPYSTSDNPASYPNYSSYNHTYSTKTNVRPPMQGSGPPYSNSNRYQPSQHTSGTPTLNQLLATPPARHPYSNYDGHGGPNNHQQPPSSLNQQPNMNWHARPQVYVLNFCFFHSSIMRIFILLLVVHSILISNSILIVLTYYLKKIPLQV